MIALLPACTAVFAVLRAGEQPSRGFWLAAGAGLVAVLAFIASQGLGEIGVADLELLVGTVVCALAYAEGGALSRSLGGPQTICWALVLAAPLSVPVTLVFLPGGHVGTDAWLGFAYVSAISMFLGVLRLVRGARARRRGEGGPDTAACRRRSRSCSRRLVLGEHITVLAMVCTLAVLASIVGTQRARVERRAPRASLRP